MPRPNHHTRRKPGLKAMLMALAAGCAAAPWAEAADLAVSAYKDVSLGIDSARPNIATAVAGGLAVALPAATGRLPAGLKSLIWSFATGECGQERWGSFDTAEFARLNVAAFAKARVPYFVATGGQAGIFSCASDAGMALFVRRYDSPQLKGFDFDIEGEQTEAQITSLMQRIRKVQLQRPSLIWRFTLATHAASDGSGRSLNRTGQAVLAAVRQAGIEGAIINLMVMDYGPADAGVCVLHPSGTCDMGASALQAALNVHKRHGVPLHRIALTAMLGVNDVRENSFSLDDARRMAHDARAHGLASVHFWSLDRDRSCAPADTGNVSPGCHGLPGMEPLGFARAFVEASSRGSARASARAHHER